MTNNIILDAFTLVRHFHKEFDIKNYPKIEAADFDTIKLRRNLIMEESQEYHCEGQRGVAELDALCDLLYVVIGTNISLGVLVIPHKTTRALTPNMEKVQFHSDVLDCTQDLDSKFPCDKIQRRALHKLAANCVDIAAMRGYRFAEAFREVHISNMSKLWTAPPPASQDHIVTPKDNDLYLVKRKGDLKVIKPPTFTPPDLTRFI